MKKPSRNQTEYDERFLKPERLRVGLSPGTGNRIDGRSRTPAVKLRTPSINELTGKMALLIFSRTYIMGLWIGYQAADNRPLVIYGEGPHNSILQGSSE
jgi:hypothetical protein